MAYTKSDRGDAPARRRSMGRRRKKVCVREERSFPEESPETARSTRER